MERRQLSFEDFGAIAAEAQRLLEGGYERAGQWSLAQICDHLSDAMKGSVRGFPWMAPWLVRRTIGPHFGKKVLAAGHMKSGIKIPEKLRPQPNDNETKAVSALEEAVRLVDEHPGTFQEHPFFGKLSPEQWRRLHLIHGSHHLSFLIPK